MKFFQNPNCSLAATSVNRELMQIIELLLSNLHYEALIN